MSDSLPQDEVYELSLTVKRLRDRGEKYPETTAIHDISFRTTPAEGEARFRTAAMIIVLGAVPQSATEIDR